jgi:hypothetical protein
VIDDGSRDGTTKQLSAFADRVRIVLTALGVSDATPCNLLTSTVARDESRCRYCRGSALDEFPVGDSVGILQGPGSEGATLRFVRKGVALLIEAWLKARLRDAELHLSEPCR